jgi:hypothetical protein
MMPACIRLPCVVMAALLCLCGRVAAGDFGTAFWVWHGGEGLPRGEQDELVRRGVRVLYWQVGELKNYGDVWMWNGNNMPLSASGGVRVVPVIRLDATGHAPFSGKSLQQLLAALAPEAFWSHELQIDYDCPDRLLGQYAAALTQLRRLVPRVSATALAGWSQLPAWLELQSSVDELFPMFYDLEPDPKLGGGNLPLPLVDPAKVERELQGWRSCKIPWEAGLPSFARVTLYDSGGTACGHLPGWTWDDLCFDPALTTSRSTQLGVTLFSVVSGGRLEDAALQAGDIVATRWPDLEALREVVANAKAAGASGIVYFRLPAPYDPSGWSLAQITNLQATPHLELSRNGAEQLELVNNGEGDLAPRLSGTEGRDRGYSLELDAPAPIFRDALEGEFWRVMAHVNPDTAPQPVPIPLATRLTFWFSHLRAGERLNTGLIQLAPGANFGQVRYRIVPGVTQWQSIP